MILTKKHKRFCVSPDRMKGAWLEPVYMASTHKDWIDVTDLTYDELGDYLEFNRLPHGEAECLKVQAELF